MVEREVAAIAADPAVEPVSGAEATERVVTGADGGDGAAAADALDGPDAAADVTVDEDDASAGDADASVEATSDAGETMPLALPEKEFFKIGEVAKLVGVKPYVLRYWEAEFKRDIRPDRTRTNQRMYRRRDIQTFLEIKR